MTLDLYSTLTIGFTIGLVGSLHCIGMCGPIAIALPLGNRSWGDKALGAFIYNLGRSVTYGIMGGVFGLLGKGIQLAGFQQWVSIIMGVIMIVSVLFPFMFRGGFSIEKYTAGFVGKMIGRFRKLFANSSKLNLLFIGLLNGLLPCGLVYLGLAGAIATGEVYRGILFMIVFGLGTLPVMFGVSIVGNLISSSLRKKLNKVVPVFIVLLGILFILRGMALGIPFISPKTKSLSPTRTKMHSQSIYQLEPVDKLPLYFILS